MKHLDIRFNVDDWLAEMLSNETPIPDHETILELITKGEHTAKIARMTLVSRELNIAPDEIMQPNKVLLEAAAQRNVSAIVRKQFHDVETTDGKMLRARDFIGVVGNSGISYEKSFVHYTSAEAISRASGYLERNLPGHIWPRLVTIYENGGDVKAAALQLKREIDEQVKKLV